MDNAWLVLTRSPLGVAVVEERLQDSENKTTKMQTARLKILFIRAS
jgi:hypothetical protein